MIETLMGFGPWGAAALLVFLGRKEILALFTAHRGDRAIETLLSEMNRQFAANMELFHVTNAHLGAIKEILGQALSIQRDVHTELVRGK